MEGIHMSYYELTPAYGRDYKSAAEAKAAWNAGKDFTGDYSMGFQLVNKPQVDIGSTVLLRYKRNTQVASVKVTNHDLTPEPVKASGKKPPSVGTMQRWMMDGVAKATDGCEVEPDGECRHGKKSWLLEMGLV